MDKLKSEVDLVDRFCWKTGTLYRTGEHQCPRANTFAWPDCHTPERWQTQRALYHLYVERSEWNEEHRYG